MAAKCARCRGVGYCDQRPNHWGVCPGCGGRGREPTRRTYSHEFHKWTWFFDDGVLAVARERFGNTAEERAAAGLPDPLSADAAAFVNRSDAVVRVRAMMEPGRPVRFVLDPEERVGIERPACRCTMPEPCETLRAPMWLPMWERPSQGKHRTARHPDGRIRFTVESKGGRLRYLWPLPGGVSREARWLLRTEYRRLAAGDRNRVVEHEPRLSPTELAALGGNRGIGRDSIGWDYDPDGVP